MAFSASVVHVSFFAAVVALLAATASGVNATVATNATVTALTGGRSTGPLPVSAAAANNSRQYTCYLCHKRNSLMIRQCPIANDDCHVACLSLPTPSPPAPPAAVATTVDLHATGGGSSTDGAHDDNDDCYVMKLYPDGGWVVVDVVSCRAAAGCYLQCGYGDAREKGADGTTPAASRGTFMPSGLPSFERCGDQLYAPGA